MDGARAQTGDEAGGSTLQDVRDAWANRTGRRLRGLGAAVLGLLVLAGVTGLLGVHTSTAVAERDGYRLEVRYASVSRAGLDTPWQVRVRHPGGFTDPVTLATTFAYFEMFEAQGLSPAPDKETAGGQFVYQEFAPPPGDVLTVTFDGYIQPASQRGRRGTTVLIVDGQEITRVDYRTVLLP
jgi:hypothetical protein